MSLSREIVTQARDIHLNIAKLLDEKLEVRVREC